MRQSGRKVLPLNGQINEIEAGAGYFCRALKKVDCEWHLIAPNKNLFRMFRYLRLLILDHYLQQ
jgi:hypothetical protein